MKTNQSSQWRPPWLLLGIVLLLILPGLSQQYLGRQTILNFDPHHSVLKPDAPPLERSVRMAHAKSNPSFVSGVGGVSFDQVALPAGNLAIGSLRLSYNALHEDGHRLELVMNEQPVAVDLPDWLLAPIVNYAESPYYSCVTLFGKLNDRTLESQITKNKGRVLNYHPAFDNTLLGIRLAYMDMLIGYPFANDLPRNSKAQYIFGAGETEPDRDGNKSGAYDLSQHIIRIQNKHSVTFRSYVISDLSRAITFQSVKGALAISGYPYYFCWRFNSDRDDYDINTVAKSLAEKYNRILKALAEKEGDAADTNWRIDKLISLAREYQDRYGFYSGGTFIDLVRLPTDDEKRRFLLRFTPGALLDLIVKTEAYMDRDTVVYLKEFSDELSAQPKLFEAANPAVWNATVMTMRYAAFFRYVKANFPEAWHALLNHVKTLDPEPRIVTPTIMFDPDNRAIRNAIENSKKN